MNGGKRSVAPGSDDSLNVYGHSLRPLTVSDGAVLRWVCVECDEPRDEVTDYAGFPCEFSPD